MTRTARHKRQASGSTRDGPSRDDSGAGGPKAQNQTQVHYIHHPSFTLPGVAKRLWGPQRERIEIAAYSLQPEVGEHDGASPPPPTTLTREQDRTLFLRYNFAKYQLRKLSEKRATPRRARQMALWRSRATRVREKIIHANLPLVPAMAKRKLVEGVEYADKVSEGYMAILRCVEHFDVSRGFKFSTYACRAILAALYRLAAQGGSYRKHVPVYFDPEYEQDDHAERRCQKERTDAVESVREVIRSNGAELNEAQAEVIQRRFPLSADSSREPRWKIGRKLGVSTERVRQIEMTALGKLGKALDGLLLTA